MAGSRARQEKVQGLLETSFFHQKVWIAKKKKKMMGSCRNDIGGRLKRAPTGQSWGDLSIRMNNDSNGL